MRKLLDIPDDIHKCLKYICVEENTNPKSWIENLIIKEVTKRTKKNYEKKQTTQLNLNTKWKIKND